MKKYFFLFSFYLLALAPLPANAQFVVSLHLSGSLPSYSQTTDYSTLYRNYIYEEENIPAPGGGVTPVYHFRGYHDSTATSQNTLISDDYYSIGAGLKLGYQIQRLQFGISGSFHYHHTSASQDATRYLANNPNCDVQSLQRQAQASLLNPDTVILDNYQGSFSQYYTSFTIAPYFRYEIVQAGDIAIFLEANAFYSKTNKPRHHDFLDWYYYEMHSTIDTTFDIDHQTVSLGALITPGLSWQLSPNCLIDLYFDCLALGYRNTTQTTVTVFDEYDYTASPRVLSRRTTTTVIDKSSHLGFDLNAAPTAKNNYSSWLRVGFSYTF